MFKTEESAKQHAGDRHKAREEGTVPGEARERTEPCALGLCNRKLMDKYGAVVHAVSSHRDEADKQDIWRKFLREMGKIPCGFCSCGGGFVRGFTTMQGYNDHARAMNH